MKPCRQKITRDRRRNLLVPLEKTVWNGSGAIQTGNGAEKEAAA